MIRASMFPLVFALALAGCATTDASFGTTPAPVASTHQPLSSEGLKDPATSTSLLYERPVEMALVARVGLYYPKHHPVRHGYKQATLGLIGLLAGPAEGADVYELIFSNELGQGFTVGNCRAMVSGTSWELGYAQSLPDGKLLDCLMTTHPLIVPADGKIDIEVHGDVPQTAAIGTHTVGFRLVGWRAIGRASGRPIPFPGAVNMNGVVVIGETD